MPVSNIDIPDFAGTLRNVNTLPALGGSNKAGSLPVALASDDVSLALLGPVTETAPATDTASSGLNGRFQRVAQRLSTLIGLVPSALGANASANSLSVTTATDDLTLTRLGTTSETAPATDTAISGLNGRMQRACQRLTSLIALLPTALGSNGGLKIEGVSGGQPMPISGTVSITDISNGEYETVAAGATAQVLGGAGATGDYIAGVLIVPATPAAGVVTLLDNATSISLFVGGGTTPLSNLVPFFVPLGMKSASGAWKLTTGTNVSAIAIGNFSA